MQERREVSRRKSDGDIERRLVALEDRMHRQESVVDRLRLGVEKNNQQTQEMYEVFADAKAGFRTLALIGKGAKPVLFVVMAIGALGAGIKTGVWKWPF